MANRRSRRNTRRNTRRNRRAPNGVFSYAYGVVDPLVNTSNKLVGRIANTGKGLVSTTAQGVRGLGSNTATGLNKAVSGLLSPIQKLTRRRRNRKMNGGASGENLSPAGVNDSLAGSSPSTMSLAQGRQYESYHMNQHGGMAPLSAISDSTLPQELHASARTVPLDGYFNDIRGLRDPNQMGAGRRGRKGRKGSRKSRKGSRKSRKGSRKSRKASRRTMRGGAATYNFNPADTSAPGLLLDPALEAKAVRGMNPEWYLAEDPKAFIPK